MTFELKNPGLELVDDIVYQRSSTNSTALHAISNCFRPGDYNWGLEYRRPDGKGKDVIVYVMEKDFSYDDVITDL